MNINFLIDLSYILASICLIFGFKLLTSPKTAIKGNLVSAMGMLIAVVATLFSQQIVNYQWILIASSMGIIIGILLAKRVPLTSMPEMVALLHGFGGIASVFVGWAEYYRCYETTEFTVFNLLAIVATIVVGGSAFSGSMVAYGKLAGKIPSKPIVLTSQKIFNSILVIGILILSSIYCSPTLTNYAALLGIIVMSLIFGVTAILPIGGADMPVVIALLNSYSGIAVCAAGFVVLNNVLIVVGALIGASGFILTKIMCKAMNRSLANVLFSGFGSKIKNANKTHAGEVKSISVEEAYYVLEAARSVLVVPGYGMAVAQAQHAIRELANFLEANGAEIKYAIHPVAGRMPGHMNVLLAEANVPYDQLVEPDDVNPTMEAVDVCLIIGANDVVNPSAKLDKTSPIYGMPIIEVDRAKTIFILKRSMNAGFSGIDNPLFTYPNVRMLFGDAKEMISRLVAEFKGGH